MDLIGLLFGGSNVNSRFEQSMAYNKSAPSKDLLLPTDDYSFMVGTDLHLKGGATHLSRFLQMADQTDFKLIMGDLTQSQPEQYERLVDSLKLYPDPPFYPLIGNHDLYNDATNSYFQYFGTSVYSFSVTTPSAKDLYICLDSGNAGLGGKQLEWLTAILREERSSYRYCIILTHVNFFMPEDQPIDFVGQFDSQELYHLLDLFAKTSVTTVFTGHIHVVGQKLFRGVDYQMVATMREDYADKTEVKRVEVSASGLRVISCPVE